MNKRVILKLLLFSFLLMLLTAGSLFVLSAAPTTPTLTLTLNGKAEESVTYGDALTLTATLADASAPTGKVTFYIDGDPIGEAVAVDPTTMTATLTAAGKPITAGTHEMTAVFEGDAANNAATSATHTLAVSRKTLTVEGLLANNKEYDGNTTATVSTDGMRVGGICESDDVGVTVSSARFENAAVGRGVNVIAMLSTTGADKANYRVVSPVTLTASIEDHVAPTASVSAAIAGTEEADNMKHPGGAPAVTVFFRGTISFSCAGADGESGIYMLEYQLVPFGSAPTADGYTALADPSGDILTVSEIGAYTVYLRATDRSGNATVIETRGFVVFCDPNVLDTTVTYQYHSKKDLTVRTALFGNTVASLVINGSALPAERFSVDSAGVITISSAYLETLAANTYTVTVKYLAGGYPFEVGTCAGNTIADSLFSLTTEKKTPVSADITVSLPDGAVYSGESVPAEIELPEGIGSVTVKYYPVSNPSTPLAGAPVNVGSYLVVLDILEGEKFTAVSDLSLGHFSIVKADVAAPVGPIAHACTTLAQTDGKISEIPTYIEYRKQGDTDFIAVTSGLLTDLAAGSYELRRIEDENHNASAILTLTVGAYRGIPELTPTVSFDAATGKLSGISGVIYFRIDGGEWRLLSPADEALFSHPLTVEFYRKGDGVYTLDSAHLSWSLTCAETPAPIGVRESLFARNDGKILGVTDKMEYRKKGESSFRAISDTAIEGLSPGEYEVRVRAGGTVLLGEAVTVTVGAAPEFVRKDLSGTAAGGTVLLAGELSEDAVLTVTAFDRDATDTVLLSAVDLRTTNVLAHLHADLHGRINGTATVSLTLGEDFADGDEITLLLAEGESITTKRLTVENGTVSFEVSGSAEILLSRPMTTPRGAGSLAWIWVLAAFLAIAGGVCVYMEWRLRKGRAQG